MAEIPITVITPGLHTSTTTSGHDYPFSTHTDDPPSHSNTSSPTDTSHTTVPDIEDLIVESSPRKQSPLHSRPSSPSRKPAHHSSWVDQIRTHLASPCPQHPARAAREEPSQSFLAPPVVETPRRPSTPRADLYRGQQEASFGMTFESDQGTHMRKSKPTPCAFKYEDQKHRMMMDWLERRGTW